MGFKNIKSKLQAERGFTIVELLIVIVVIGILATITIVAYNGVTARANKTSAQAAASSVLKKVEAYNAEESKYPTAGTALTGANQDKSYYLSGITIDPTDDPDSTNGKNTVRFLKCAATVQTAQDDIDGSTVPVSGASIRYYDFVAGNVQSVSTGDATSCPTSNT